EAEQETARAAPRAEAGGRVMAKHDELLQQGPHEAPEPETAEERPKRVGVRTAAGGVATGGDALPKFGVLGKLLIWFVAWHGPVGMHPQTLRMYEQKGLVDPKRTAGNTRLYSEADLERLRLIQKLTTQLGLNLAGVEAVLELQEELQRMQARMQRLEREMRDAI